MIKGISVWAFPGAPAEKDLPTIMEQAGALGYEAIELAVEDAGQLTLNTSEKACKELAAAARGAGVRITSVAFGLGWKYSLSAQNAARRKRNIDRHRRGLQITRWLGTDAMLVIPGMVYVPWDPKAPVVPYDDAYKTARSSLRQLARTAEKHRVHACCEIVWNGMLYSPIEFRRFLDEIGSRYVNMYFDTANVVNFGFPEHWINALGKRIKRVHFKDFRRRVGTLEGFCDLLEGDVSYPAVMRALKRVGYKGPCVLETFGRTLADLRKESQAMDRILGRRTKRRR